jgi:hypothetical protein
MTASCRPRRPRRRLRSALAVLAAMLAATLLASALAPWPAAAATAPASGAYQVEVLIFRAKDPPAGEDLSAPAEGRGFGNPVDPDTPPPELLRTLDSSHMQLGNMASRLRSSGAWTVLAHAAWVQTATDWPRHVGLKLEQLGLDAAELSGSVYLERGQFLHLGFDLHLGTSPVWSLSELRKIRFNEKSYFDHPGFGVIAIVSPVARGTGP